MFTDIDDFKRAASDNNAIKLRETDKAELILAEKLEETKKSIRMSDFMEKDGSIFARWKARPFGTVFYKLKDQLTAEQLRAVMDALEQVDASEQADVQK